MRLVLSALLLVFAAQTPGHDWESIGPWGGVDIILSTPDPSGQRVYAISSNGLFRSDDRGVSWTSLPAPDGHRIYPSKPQFAITRADPDRIAAVFGNQFAYLSVDGGNEWELVDTASDPIFVRHITAIAIDHHDPERMSIFHGPEYHYTLANPTGPVWRHTDNAGATFEETALPTLDICHYGYRAIVSAQYDPDEAGRLVYTDATRCHGGIEFWYQLFSAQANAFDYVSYVVLPLYSLTSAPSASVVMEAGGYLWLTGPILFRAEPTASEPVIVLKGAADFSLTDSGTLLAGSMSGLLRSDDHGESWHAISNDSFGIGGTESAYALSGVMFDDGYILASSKEGVFGLELGGADWAPRSNGLSALRVRTVAVAPDDRRYWAGADSVLNVHDALVDWLPSGKVLYRSIDAGRSWLPSNMDSYAHGLSKIVIDPDTLTSQDGTVLYAAGDGCSYGCAEYGLEYNPGAYKSIDSGANWTALNGIPEDGTLAFMRDISIDISTGSPSNRRIYGTYNPQVPARMLVRSLNSGSTWTTATDGLPSAFDVPPHDRLAPTSLASSASKPGLAFLGTYVSWDGPPSTPAIDAGIFRTEDGGDSWQHASEGLPRHAPDASHAGVVSITVHPTQTQFVWALASVPSQNSSSIVETQVYKSTDGARSWRHANVGLPTDFYRQITIDEFRPDYLYVVGEKGAFYTSNGGLVWQRLGRSEISRLTSLAVGSEYIYVAGSQGIHRLRKPRPLTRCWPTTQQLRRPACDD